MTTTRALLEDGIERLRAAGLETPRLDAEVLLGSAVGADRTAILAHPDALVGDGPAAAFDAMVARRAAGEPVAYIRGIKEFHGIALGADPRALIPRPETEALVGIALTDVMARLTGGARPDGGGAIRVLDVGTGSGAIAIAIAVELRRRRVPPDEVTIDALDISPEALDLARENAVAHGVGDRLTFVVADLTPPPTSGPWDVIVANLPYVATDALAALGPPTSFEPALALDGGPTGTALIERLLERIPTMLAPGGLAVLEIGADQADAVTELVSTTLPGWTCRITNDLAGLPRVASLSEAPA
jgi:release factor glutamine methyltransferase